MVHNTCYPLKYKCCASAHLNTFRLSGLQDPVVLSSALMFFSLGSHSRLRLQLDPLGRCGRPSVCGHHRWTAICSEEGVLHLGYMTATKTWRLVGFSSKDQREKCKKSLGWKSDWPCSYGMFRCFGSAQCLPSHWVRILHRTRWIRGWRALLLVLNHARSCTQAHGHHLGHFNNCNKYVFF